MEIDALSAVTASARSASDVESAICARRPLSPVSDGGGDGDNSDGDARWADLLNCCSCGEELCDGPLLLACLHVSCRKCFDTTANAAGNGCGGGDRVMAVGKRMALCAACQRDSATAAAPMAAAGEGNADEPLDNFLVESLVRARRMRTGAAACGFCDDDEDNDASCDGSGSGGSSKSKRSGAAATHWCVDCARYMCNRCFLFHSRFNAAHLVFTPGSGGGTSSALPQPLLPVLCRQHGGAVCSLYCGRCERLLCRECSERCLADNHGVVRVGSEQAATAAHRLADELRDACSKLEEKARRLTELSGGGGKGGTPAAAAAEVDEARRRDLATQDENFRLALDMVDEAYHEALAALDKLNGGAEVGAQAVCDRKEAERDMKEDAAAAEKKAVEDEEERLLRSLEHALEFAAALMDPAGGCGGMELLQFHEPVERRLRALCDRADRCLAAAAAAAEAPAAAVLMQQPNVTETTPERRVVIECHQPSNFSDVALNWIGVPHQQMHVGDDGVDLHTSELSPSDDGSASLAVQLRSASTSPASSANAAIAAANAAAAATDDRPRVLHFGSARRRIDVPLARALGMSVSAEGHVLVAASLDGLVEYDAEAGGGGELGRWQPPPELGDDVRAVECLEDGRVAVAISASQATTDAPPPSAAASTLLLLGKPDDGGATAAWREARRLALRCKVLRLAACGETLAVLGIATRLPEDGASAAADDGGGGRDLDLMCMYDGQSLLSRTLDYPVGAVTLTARAVVLASAGRRDADFGGGGGGEYSLEAYSYDWAPLWRRDRAYPVRDICPQPLGYVLYISCGDDDADGGGGGCCAMKTVVAVSAEDGGYLCDLVHEPLAEGDAAAADGAILAYDGLRAQLALMLRVSGGCSGPTSSVAIVELRPATVFK